MNIDGQLMEMKEKAKREKINIVEIVTESHSAKETGQRPQFNYLLDNIYKAKYGSIITWVPDRLSRNAGDLGRIVDLMDQGKLKLINCYFQSFSNNPNEKFLLMILCSQAKLENDNRGINVRRRQRNKSMIGIKPGPAPIGYINILKANRISSAQFDKERAHEGNERVKTIDKMTKNYLLHILQERVKILKGIRSRFELRDRKLFVIGQRQ